MATGPYSFRSSSNAWDFYDQVEPLVGGFRRWLETFLLGGRRPGRRRKPEGPALGLGVEVGDLDRLAVHQKLEVLLPEAGHRVAPAVGDEDLDVDHLDTNLALLGGEGRRREQQGERDGPREEGAHRSDSTRIDRPGFFVRPVGVG